MSEKKDPKKEESHPSAAIVNALLESRSVLLFGEVDLELSQKITAQMLAMAHISSDPIFLYINSPGGHVESGDTIHDLIRYIEPEVKIIGSGCVASIAAHIFLAGKNSNRFCLPNTRFLLHQPSGGMQGQATDISIQATEILRMKDRINRIIAEETGQSVEEVKQHTDRDYWMSPEEAIEYGMVSKVINSIKEI